jgi:DNA-binding CsgD family transcriptional regulator
MADRGASEHRLSPRQLACPKLVAAGKTTLEIGVELGISNRTVEQYVAEACRRLGVRTRIEAVVKTVRLGLISDEPSVIWRTGKIPELPGCDPQSQSCSFRWRRLIVQRTARRPAMELGGESTCETESGSVRQAFKILLPLPQDKPTTNLTAEPRSFLQLDAATRQLEILAWVEQGKSATDIGGILGISHRTVEHHLEKVCNNLGVRTRFQAVLKVRDLDLITSTDP